jgi:hypothetical protein
LYDIQDASRAFLFGAVMDVVEYKELVMRANELRKKLQSALNQAVKSMEKLQKVIKEVEKKTRLP